MKENRKSLYHQKTKLPNDFFPSSVDVICARGKQALEHPGNHKFRALVKSHIPLYSDCQCRFQKSNIVSKIMREVQSASPEGGFVKKINGTWYQVSDRHAREKIGQTFRDFLHDSYASSTKAKAKIRQQRRREKVATPCHPASSSSASVVSDSSSEKGPVEVPSIITVLSSSDTEEEKPFPVEDKSLQLERMNSLAAVLRIIGPDPVVVGCSNSDDSNHMDLEPLPMEECTIELELVDSSSLSESTVHPLLFDHAMEQFARCIE